MEKINFINGETPLNDETFNQMQENIEEAIPTVEDSLTSDSATNALSAKQGRILKEKMLVATYEDGYIDPDTTLEPLILTANKTPGGSFFYIRTYFYNYISVNSNRCQIAIGYWDTGMYQRYYYNGSWSSWSKIDNKYVCNQLSSRISTKGEFTLSDNINNYDEIRVWATQNAYDHRLICNTYKHNLFSDFVHFISYTPTDSDSNLKIYGNKIDTSTCDNFGVDNRHIYCVEGIKYNN